MFTRRQWLVSAFSLVGGRALPVALAHGDSTKPSLDFEKRLVDLEKASGGRLGVAFLNTGTNAMAGHRAEERFSLCSTFKLLAVGAVFARVDRGKEKLDRTIVFTKADIVTYSPVTEKLVGTPGMSVKELCAAAMMFSDNTAGNLLLGIIGGTQGMNDFARTIGDDKTRLDRIEPDLNEALPDDPRDTTTPSAMLSNLHALVVGNALSGASKAQLTEWLVQCKTGDKRLRSGLPTAWKVGDKTGAGERGTTNDVAVAWPPGQPPILVSVYLTGATGTSDDRNAVIAAVGKEIPAALGLPA